MVPLLVVRVAPWQYKLVQLSGVPVFVTVVPLCPVYVTVVCPL
jgi:hypothetical protein